MLFMSRFDVPINLLLFARDHGALPSAMRAAAEFLAFRRRRSDPSLPAEELLGICLRNELDKSLPVWPRPDSPGSPTSRDVEVAIGVRQSLSLPGVWALCWFYGPSLSRARTGATRRRRIFEALCGPAGGTTPLLAPKSFIPVFQESEGSAAIAAAIRGLRDSHPAIVRDQWYVYRPPQGLQPAPGKTL